jgi:hypothetical protein
LLLLTRGSGYLESDYISMRCKLYMMKPVSSLEIDRHVSPESHPSLQASLTALLKIIVPLLA